MNTEHDRLLTFFGTSTPRWSFGSDSDALKFFNADAEYCLGVALSAQEAGQIRALTGAIQTVEVCVVLQGEMTQLVLVGKQVNAGTWAGVTSDINNKAATVSNITEGLSFAEQVVAEVNSLVVIIDKDFKIRRFNLLCEEKTGMLERDVIGMSAVHIFVADGERQSSGENLRAFFNSNNTTEVLRSVIGKEGVRQIMWRNKFVRGGAGSEPFLVCSGTDVTEELAAKQRLIELATRDNLTGLINRHAIQIKIGEMIEARPDEAFGLMFIDLDNFKQVNDALGHLKGDQLIIAVSDAIKNCLEEKDILARIGGDEFLVLSLNAGKDALENIAQRVLEAVRRPFTLGTAQIYPGASLGLALYPDHGANMTELIRSADMAMYVAKDEGGQSFRTFSHEMNERAQECVWLDNNLRNAIDKNEFFLVYQPKVCLQTGDVSSIEALIRWRSPERGLIMPMSFIPYAEKSGLIVAIGKWALNEAARQARAFSDAGYPLRIAINVSARQLKNEDLIGEFEAALVNNRLGTCPLDIEITESCVIEDEVTALRVIERFKTLGAKVHLDDFGTGYSSLSQLSRLPLDAIKLDQIFISDCAHSKKSQGLIRSIGLIAREFGFAIVAEGVETGEQEYALKVLGIEMAQGYHFSRPLSAEDLLTWLKDRKTPTLRASAQGLKCGTHHAETVALASLD